MFLTILNASLSNMILFKNQFVLTRELSSMFASFQDGATVFQKNAKIFQVMYTVDKIFQPCNLYFNCNVKSQKAELCVIIRDVAEQDSDDVVAVRKYKGNK